MSRFRELCSSSDSDEQTQSSSFQRGRVRENKRFTQVKKEDILAGQTKKSAPKKAKQPTKNFQKQKDSTTSIFIQTNQYTSGSTLNAKQKFIRQNVKPVQQQVKHYLQKMYKIRNERGKFTNALTTCNRDLQKVDVKIEQLKAQKLKGNHSYNYTKDNITQKDSSKSQSQDLSTMLQLQSKISRHLSNLMSEHQKTIDFLLQSRKQMDKHFVKLKFSFLDLDIVQFYEEQTQKYEEYGVEKIYELFQKADQIINEVTSFNK